MARESRRYHGAVAQIRARTVPIIGLNRFPLPLRDANRCRMRDGDVEKHNGACGSVNINSSITLNVFRYLHNRILDGFRREGEAVRPLIDIGEVDHQLHVVHTKRMRLPMRPVTMKPLMGFVIIRSHVAQADLGETDRSSHQKFNRR